MRALGAALIAMAVCGACGHGRTVSYSEARKVVDLRCVECHSAEPTSRAFPIAPKGVKLDTAEEMKRWAGRIDVRTVKERTMPIANLSGMTEAERQVLAEWVAGGAKIP